MSKQKGNQLGLTKEQAEVYENECLGECSICMLDGDCEIQDKLKGLDNG